jgi:putative oxidoreductase
MPDFGMSPLDMLRILCGIWFLPHIYGKIKNFEKATETFVATGLKPGKLFIVLTLVLECVAVVGMVFNIYPEYATACAVIVLLGATYSVNVRNDSLKWRWQR